MTSLAQNRDFMHAEAIALAQGFTRWVELASAFGVMSGWVRPDADLTSTFDLISAEDGERLTLIGELFHLRTP